MGTITLSLNQTLERKAEILRDRCYPNLTVGDAVKEFFKDSLNAKVPEVEP
jgi:hypothetical protein